MNNDFARSDRVASQLKRELAVLIRDELRDPGIHSVSLSDVEVSRDLAHARVFFLTAPEHVEETLQGLGRSAGFLRKQLGKVLKLRVIPQLHFHYDDSIERGDHIEQLLAKALDPKK